MHIYLKESANIKRIYWLNGYGIILRLVAEFADGFGVWLQGVASGVSRDRPVRLGPFVVKGVEHTPF